MRPTLIFSVLCLLFLAACAGEPPAEETAAGAEDHAGDAEGIAWFEGSVDEAFALAEAEGKPVFLYWGAVWCPPCHYLKNNVFARPDFVETSRRFVAVYLDGDTERAQILGEKFATQGYPTVILFDPTGREILRVASTTPVEEYAGVLELALERMRPIDEVLAAVEEVGAGSAEPRDLELLAFHAWSQDESFELTDEEQIATFERLWRQTPDGMPVVETRFLTLFLGAAIMASYADEEGAPPVLDAEQRAAAAPALRELLEDPELRRANLSFLTWNAGETVELLYDGPSAERAAMMAAWERAARSLEEDESLSADDRVAMLFTRLALARLEAGEGGEGEGEAVAEVPEELKEAVRRRVAWAIETVRDESELQSTVNTMAALLQEAGLRAEAEEVLREKLAETKAPYYYMSWLGSLKSEAGETGEALDLYRRAYESADGRYTRFRWGSIYLRQLMELRPEDADTIEAESKRILEELLALDDAFAGGNALRLSQLDGAYEAWNEEGSHEAVVAGLRQMVHARCADYPDDGEPSQRQRCEGFLADETEVG